jgi:hypothetical protein
MLDQEGDLSLVLAEVAGIEPHALRRSQALRLGLVRLFARRGGGMEIEIGWTLERLLDRPSCTPEELLETVVGPRQQARLALVDFAAAAARSGLPRTLAGWRRAASRGGG